MTTGKVKEQPSWETETGLPNDVDAYISNPRFGLKDEYAQAVAATGAEEAGLMFLVDLIDKEGELLGSQGYSIGSGWTPSEDGSGVSHAKRKNVVGNSRYGQLQQRVVKDLGVDMEARGLPTQAKSWLGLGFHWMLEEHPTVGGETKQGLMPTDFLGVLEGAAAAAPAPAAIKVAAPEAIVTKLTDLAQTNAVKVFQIEALKVPGVTANEELMASILNEGDDGFWATHQK